LTRSSISAVPIHVLEQIDEVINDVVAGAGTIPQDGIASTHSPSVPMQLISLTQSKLATPQLIAPHHPYAAQQPPTDWSNYQQQQQQQPTTLNIAAVRGPTAYSNYLPANTSSQAHHDLLPATTNVINTAGVPQHEQQQIVAERISSILSSSTHDQQVTPITTNPVAQPSIQIKRTWSVNHHGNNETHFLGKYWQRSARVENCCNIFLLSFIVIRAVDLARRSP
jgi:hypothetical protein